MKSFDEFLETISDDDFNKMLEDAVNAVNNRKKLTAATDFNDMCLLQNIAVLRKYHNWLMEQLGE